MECSRSEGQAALREEEASRHPVGFSLLSEALSCCHENDLELAWWRIGHKCPLLPFGPKWQPANCQILSESMPGQRVPSQPTSGHRFKNDLAKPGPGQSQPMELSTIFETTESWLNKWLFKSQSWEKLLNTTTEAFNQGEQLTCSNKVGGSHKNKCPDPPLPVFPITCEYRLFI